MLVLAELTPLNASSGSRVTLRAASADDRAITGLNSVRWWPALKDVGALTLRLFDGDFSSATDVGAMTFTLLTDKLARLDSAARGYRWAGAGVKIYAGNSGDAWPWTQWLEGKVDGFDAQANQLRLRVRVNTEPFDKNALTASYAGTGGAEGGADLKNKVKPWLFGRALNVEPVPIDTTNSVYQFSGYGPIQAVNNLYERASDYGAAIGDYASYAALVAAAIPAGRWGTCLASGMVRLGAPAYGVITGDVDGDKPSTWLRKTGEIINRVATNAGISAGLLDTTSLTALDTAVPYNINLFLNDQTTVLELARRLAQPCNAQAGISWLGKLFATRVAIGSPAITLDAQGRQKPGVIASIESDVSPPYWRVEMGAQRSWRVHSFDEIASTAPLLNRGAYSGSATYREGNIAQDQSSSWLYVNPTPTSGNAPPTLPTTSNSWWQVMAQGTAGATGAAGLNNATVTLYQRATSAPAVPSTTTTYTFATSVLSGTLAGWTQSVPGGTDPIWTINAPASGTGATDTIATGEWSSPNIFAQNGLDGTLAWTPIVASMTRSGSLFTSTGGGTDDSVFGAMGRSTEIDIGLGITAIPGQTNHNLCIGLDASPAAATNYNLVDFCVVIGTSATLTAFANGTSAGSIGTYATSDIVAVEHRGTTVVAVKNGVVIYTWTGVSTTTPLGAVFGFDSTGTMTLTLSKRGFDGAAGSTGATGSAGSAGANGLSNGPVWLYQRAASTPSVPSATTTYTFATGILTGINNGWSQTIPATNGNPLYATAATASGSGATDTIATGEWATPVILVQDGAAGSAGAAGATAATVYLFQRAASAPSVPGSTTTYTFATSILSGTLGSWTQTVPAGSNPLYVTTATALGTGATDTIPTGEWATPTVMAQDGATGSTGAAGQNAATVYLFQRATSAPSVPGSTTTYTFATGILSGTLGSWTQLVPGGTNPLYVTTAAAVGTGATDTIGTGEWATPQVFAQNGSQVVSAYRRGIVKPSTPSGNGTPTGWSATSLDASADFVPITSAGLSVNADYTSFQKVTAGSASWDESFRSTTAAVGMTVGFRPAQADKYLSIGLNSDPATDNSYTSVDYQAHLTNGGSLHAFTGSTNLGFVASYVAGDSITVEHRGTTIVITLNGSVVYTFSGVSATASFYADSSFGDLNAKVTGVFVTNGDLWVSQAVQDLAGVTSGSWSTAIQMSGSIGTDGNYRDIKFIRSFAQPATPTGDNPSGWSDGAPSGAETLWMSVVLKSFAGAALGAWSTPQPIGAQTPRGDYNSGTTYYLANTVFYNGGTYFASQDNFSGHAPSGTGQANSYWDVAAAPGPPGTPAVPPSAFSATINLTSTTGTVNLRSIADANGYTGNSDATITFNVPSGVTIRALSGSGTGIDSGSWPTASYAIAITLVVQSGGIVDGGGGVGGPGSWTDTGDSGGAGGDAIFCRLPMTVTINSGGTLRGGGGGGGGGGAKIRNLSGEVTYNPGSGGGGGFPNGAAGIGAANDGAAGTTSGGGAGGTTVLGGGAGGAGGGAGAVGSHGGASSNATGDGGTGGAAGYAVRKNGNTVTVTISGTMTGTAA